MDLVLVCVWEKENESNEVTIIVKMSFESGYQTVRAS